MFTSCPAIAGSSDGKVVLAWVVTVAAAGTVSYSEKHAIDTCALDEDPGKVVIGMADINTPIFAPRNDEVYASVTVSTASVTKKSATVSSEFGV